MEKNDKVDLHIHTTYSNGKDSLISVLEHAEKNGVKVISITDYNSLKSYIELKKNVDISKYFSGEIIVGLEVRCKFKGENGQERYCDMLAYNIDIDNIEDMQNWLDQNTDRDKSILEQVKQQQELAKERKREEEKVIEKVEEVLITPTEEIIEGQMTIDDLGDTVSEETNMSLTENLIQTTFVVTGTLQELIEIREFLKEGGYNYECK